MQITNHKFSLNIWKNKTSRINTISLHNFRSNTSCFPAECSHVTHSCLCCCLLDEHRAVSSCINPSGASMLLYTLRFIIAFKNSTGNELLNKEIVIDIQLTLCVIIPNNEFKFENLCFLKMEFQPGS